MWTPTGRIGEGGTDGEEPGAGARQHDNHRAPIQQPGVRRSIRWQESFDREKVFEAETKEVTLNAR
jgi:hypothetical protein